MLISKLTLHLFALNLLVLLLLSACTASPESPEEKINAVIDKMEKAIEERKNSNLMVHIYDEYSDHAGHTKSSLRKMATAYMLRSQNINLVINVQSVELIDKDTAAVEATVLMAGTENNPAGNLPFLKFDNQRVSGVFNQFDEQWLLTSLSWESQTRH